ncbi:MAG TPA: B12-binding domain-containing protein [Nitrososphaeraceae archaeon]|nr:B12-binding domain-containing protein [Nitrososphaeraceae archaeon]
MDKDAPQIEFPLNIHNLQQKFLDCLLEGNETQAINIISNLLFSTILKERILFDIILPTLNILNDMYDRGKISEIEKLLISTSALDLALMTKFVSTIDTPKLRAYSIIVSGSEEATYQARIASVILHLIGWHSLYLGNVENKIDPFFDIDIQRLITKKLKNVNGLSAVMIFSFNANTLKFLSNTIKALKKKVESELRIAIYTNNDLLQVSHEMDVDYSTTELTSLIDWAKDEYRNTLS